MGLTGASELIMDEDVAINLLLEHLRMFYLLIIIMFY